MKRVVEFPIEGAGSLLVEVEEQEIAGPRPAGVGDGAVERAAIGLEQAIAKVRPLAEALLRELGSLTRQPDEVTVEFGIKLNAAAGIVIANTAVEGNCQVKLAWKPPR